MKKNYILLSFLLMIISFSFAQTPIITMIADGDCTGGNPKVLEIYANGTVDFSQYSLENQTNASTTWGNPLDLSPLGTVTDDYVYIYKSTGTIFDDEFPSVTSNKLEDTGSTMSFNGDDRIRIVKTSDSTVIDQYGVESVDGTGEPWEYKDGYAKRNPGTSANGGTFDVANWTFYNGALNGQGTCQNGPTFESIIGLATYTQTNPTLTITYPTNNSTINATTSVDVAFTVANFTIGNPGDAGVDGHVHYSTDNGATWSMHYSTAPITITVVPGNTYTVMLKLVDNSHADLTPPVTAQTIFTVDLPCDLNLDSPTTTCNGTTMYDIDIPFTGGNTSTYTLNANVGTVGGDDPSIMAAGTITVTGVPVGTDVVFTAVGDATTSSCNLTRNVTSPFCGTVTCAAVGSVIITEVMQNPNAVADNLGEWFEVYNTTANPINLQGWEFVDDNNASEMFTVTTSLVIQPNSYLLFANNGDSTTNGGLPTPDYVYSDFYLGNSSDGIIIRCAANDIDSVVWDNGNTFPDPTGASMALDPTKLDATSNDVGANWHEETVNTYGAGDFGTPGAANSPAAAISDNELEGFNVYPNPVQNVLYVNTLNNNNKTIELFSVIGKRVYANKTTDTNFTVNVAKFNTGLYILKVSDGTSTSIQKVMIK